MRRNSQQVMTLIRLCRGLMEQRQSARRRDHDLLGRVTARDVEATRARMEARYQEWETLGRPDPSAAAMAHANERRQVTWEAWKRESLASRRLARAHAWAEGVLPQSNLEKRSFRVSIT
jgi:hypothetical protein